MKNIWKLAIGIGILITVVFGTILVLDPADWFHHYEPEEKPISIDNIFLETEFFEAGFTENYTFEVFEILDDATDRNLFYARIYFNPNPINLQININTLQEVRIHINFLYFNQTGYSHYLVTSDIGIWIETFYEYKKTIDFTFNYLELQFAVKINENKRF